MWTPALVVVLLSAATSAIAKPPPAGAPPPWASYASKPGMAMRRSPVPPPGADAGPDSAYSPYAPGLVFNPLFGGPGVGAAAPVSLSPFFALKPFLPAKPTFMPPVVDPAKFIDMKTSLLNSLFAGAAAAPPAPPSSLAARALFSPFAAPAAAGSLADPSLFSAPSPVTKSPPPAYLADLFKALNINKTVANASDTAAAQASPFAPSGPLVDPGMIISKKAKYLSDLFASMSTTTLPPPPAPEVAPAPASIVPPDFWLPTSSSDGLVDPVSYADKVSGFLDKLFDSLNLSQPAGPSKSLQGRAALMDMDMPEDEMESAGSARGKRSVAAGSEPSDDPVALLNDAREKVVDTIIGELAVLKNSMVGAVSDLASAQKAAALPAPPAAKKPPMSPFAAMWAKPSGKPTSSPVPSAAPAAPAIDPVLQRVTLLGQVFDMLTDMEKDITSAMTPPAMPSGSSSPIPAAVPSAAPGDLMAAIQEKMNQLLSNNASSPTNHTASPPAKIVRMVSASPPDPSSGAPFDPTFWIPDTLVPEPDAYLAKTKEFLTNIMAAKATTPSPLAKRSYNWYDQQQGKKQLQQEQSAPTQQQRAPPNRQDRLQNIKDPLLEYYMERHHHHNHNRQPYWWN